MFSRNLTFNDVERLQSLPGEAACAFQMDQDTFRALYERTARPLWVYLWRRTGDPQLADDLLQETYYRFLRARGTYEGESHRRNYLYRIATNLANDSYRRHKEHLPLSDETEPHFPKQHASAELSQQRTDLERAMSHLATRQRDALWLAYVEGSSHEEIAEVLGLKTGSIKLLLFRARRKLAKLLREKNV
jgi:RNA polymerase sigma-70 factor, ECF subfamily